MLIRRNYFHKNRFLSFLHAPLHYRYDVTYRNNNFYRSLVLNFFASYSTTAMCGIQARCKRGGIGGIAPPIFIFAPQFISCPPTVFFFLEVSIALTVEIVVILTVPSPILTSILFD